MEFKAGDRVHVRMLHGGRVDFFATLRIFDEFHFELTDCSNTLFNNFKVFRPNTEEYRLNDCYYYTLVTEEKNVRELLIENKKLKKEIEKLEEDNEQLCKLGYEIYKELFKYRRLTDNIRHKYETKPGRYSDLMDLINEMEDK